MKPTKVPLNEKERLFRIALLQRRERDSNPRYRFQYDSLANCSFRPLRHLSLFWNANIAIQSTPQK